jgi:hypothetical protein
MSKPLPIITMMASYALALLLPCTIWAAQPPAPNGDSPAKAKHWAFLPVRKPPVPAVTNTAFIATDVDRYIVAKLEQRGLSPSPRADKRSLLLRATYDLIGLPPTAEQSEYFENDPSPDAFAQLVDRLLGSPRFGERWGRYWLDVARYADTKGYIFTEERKFPYSYTYRDWVIRAFNEDLPFDQFLIQQIAADQLELGADKRPLAALGFLTLGRRFLGNMHDIIDDRIDVVTRGTMGLTVQCARCHDHKYDPIPQADYYSLYGVFASCSDKELPIAAATPEFEQELHKREAELNEFQDTTLARTLQKLRANVSEYLLAAESLKDHPDIQEFMFVENPGEVNRFALGRWRTYLELQSKEHHPVWAPWFALAAIPEAEFTGKAADVSRQFVANADPGKKVNALVARLFETESPRSIKDVAERYGRLFAEIESAWQKSIEESKSSGTTPPTKLDDPVREELRQVLYSNDSPTAVPRRRVDDLFEKPDADKLRQFRKKVQEWRTSPEAPPNAMALVDNDSPANPVVFVRGNPGNRGPAVPRQFLAVLAGDSRKPFEHGSGRLDLACAIASPENPLTARVFVNRVWTHLFGAGLVRTPSDFGVRSDPPTHPELLDYLAARFVEDGWSVKRLIRLIMLSNVYQQSSDSTTANLRSEISDLKSADPDNRLLSHQNRRRLDFEAMRDSLLAAAGDIDLTAGGPAVDLAKQPFNRRRTVYGFVERQNLPGMLRTFDFASPDHHCPQRFTTTVPQQALFLMNSPFVVEQARRLANRPDVLAEADPGVRLQRVYRHALGRPASPVETEIGLKFVQHAEGSSASTLNAPQSMGSWEQVAQVLLLSNEFIFVD